MNGAPRPAASVVPLLCGASAAAPGVLWLHESRAIVAADVHFAYEHVIGAALPAWSTAEIVASLTIAARSFQANEIVLLGDVIHGSRMSEAAARCVRDALDVLRGIATLTIVAGNHEGRSRGAAVLGETVESIRRDGWLLLHGDRPPQGVDSLFTRSIIGHLHPSLALRAGTSAPAFLASDKLIVLPALTPYSRGLDVCSEACASALLPWGVSPRDLCVVIAAGELLYPFGLLSELRRVVNADEGALVRRKPGHRGRQP